MRYETKIVVLKDSKHIAEVDRRNLVVRMFTKDGVFCKEQICTRLDKDSYVASTKNDRYRYYQYSSREYGKQVVSLIEELETYKGRVPCMEIERNDALVAKHDIAKRLKAYMNECERLDNKLAEKEVTLKECAEEIALLDGQRNKAIADRAAAEKTADNLRLRNKTLSGEVDKLKCEIDHAVEKYIEKCDEYRNVNAELLQVKHTNQKYVDANRDMREELNSIKSSWLYRMFSWLL